MHYLYLIKNEINELYFGCTHDLKRRFKEHNSGKSAYTRGHRWKLIYYEAYLSKEDAFLREKRLKQFGQSMSHLKNRLKFTLSKN